jgi:hypothetical protein
MKSRTRRPGVESQYASELAIRSGRTLIAVTLGKALPTMSGSTRPRFSKLLRNVVADPWASVCHAPLTTLVVQTASMPAPMRRLQRLIAPAASAPTNHVTVK